MIQIEPPFKITFNSDKQYRPIMRKVEPVTGKTYKKINTREKDQKDSRVDYKA